MEKESYYDLQHFHQKCQACFLYGERECLPDHEK